MYTLSITTTFVSDSHILMRRQHKFKSLVRHTGYYYVRRRILVLRRSGRPWSILLLGWKGLWPNLP